MTDPLGALRQLRQQVQSADQVSRLGRVTGVTGPVIRATIPDSYIGEVCRVARPGRADLEAEIIGFDRNEVLMMPLGTLEGVPAQAAVTPGDGEPRVPCGESVRGRVIGATGQPLDGLGPIPPGQTTPLWSPPPNPLLRRRVTEPAPTGVRAIDSLLTVGRGQRVGIFAGAGSGKSTLLGAIAKSVDADLVVVALIGERGREVRGFKEDVIGERGMERAVLVVSCSDEPALVRLRAAYAATAIAEHSRRQGRKVVLLMDSVTRFARALREVGLAAGEAPGRQGYPASVFAALPRLFERAGNDEEGSITAFYTVLVTGDDIQEPVADETMSLLDGHIILSRRLAARGHYPAIDVTASKSRLRNEIVSKPHRQAADRVLGVVASYDENYDKITLGLYQHSGPTPDPTRWYPKVEKFLRQETDEPAEFSASVAAMMAIDAGFSRNGGS
jgi:FliI/YscN family ATPase